MIDQDRNDKDRLAALNSQPASTEVHPAAPSVSRIPKIKAIVKMARGMGKTINTITVHVDGSFTLGLGSRSAMADCRTNPWDEVLPNGSA